MKKNFLNTSEVAAVLGISLATFKKSIISDLPYIFGKLLFSAR